MGFVRPALVARVLSRSRSSSRGTPEDTAPRGTQAPRAAPARGPTSPAQKISIVTAALIAASHEMNGMNWITRVGGGGEASEEESGHGEDQAEQQDQ